jgi:hypothetical protein
MRRSRKALVRNMEARRIVHLRGFRWESSELRFPSVSVRSLASSEGRTVRTGAAIPVGLRAEGQYGNIQGADVTRSSPNGAKREDR